MFHVEISSIPIHRNSILVEVPELCLTPSELRSDGVRSSSVCNGRFRILLAYRQFYWFHWPLKGHSFGKSGIQTVPHHKVKIPKEKINISIYYFQI